MALSQVVTEEQLVERSEAFENAVTGRDRTSLQASPVVGCWRAAGLRVDTHSCSLGVVLMLLCSLASCYVDLMHGWVSVTLLAKVLHSVWTTAPRHTPAAA